MNKVVISGRGLITPLGNSLSENESALRAGRSGTVRVEEWAGLNLNSLVAGIADEDPPCSFVDEKRKRFIPANGLMALAAVEQALKEANLSLDELRNSRVAVIGGCAGSNYQELYENAKAFADTGKVRKVSPFIVPRVMASSAVANISLLLGITGESFDISSACASGAYAVMIAARMIHAGLYDIVIAGGSEELNWIHALGFNAIRALSRRYNDTPAIASRPFDVGRDGFVIAEGAGYLVLESEAHALRRNIKPKGVISGWHANSNATDMVQPAVDASADVMRTAVKNAGLRLEDIDYINTHGTATPVGDPVEMRAIKEVFGGRPAINSTKSMTGHMIGATGSSEIIFTSMMLENKFICPSINLDNPEPEFEWADLVTELRDGVNLRHAVSNSFAFGGTNVCLVVSASE